ncbi:conserved exported hypothetical protein [Sphingomonas sp. EC-HK361]|jgi:hypothetical protein|uniref:hypothetical protein n=1 Tax=Sphingomonas sp. EC-HK361 TaxID=2038397 RepID=UPI001250F6D2|nr:hypothetical protein [Sphingomonas sp. EC-HK361]VVT07228.1 conserved exported hypothetical protein [Sphingomonas sp. EC-HK361]
MTKSLPFTLLAGAALISGASAFAATTPAKTTATKTVAMKTTTHAVARTTHPAVAGRMVTTKTSTGKSITYNCSKAGNANKTACKK